jgi:2-polyprenyl-6-methoxyphenol hydroxylase-like FAD-dependent oxidoreductase
VLPEAGATCTKLGSSIMTDIHFENSGSPRRDHDAAAKAAARIHDVDVAVVGGGLSGSLAAVVLGRAGYRVAVVDRHAEYPAEFRVEKIAGDQVDLLRRLGLLDCVAAASTPFDRVINARRGRIIDRTYGQHYGLLYEDIIRAVRAQLPPAVAFLVDRVVDVETSAHRQQVRLAGGDVVDARLIVLATGMSDVLRQKLGIVRRTTFEKHSISFGFNIAPAPGRAFDFPALTYYGERMADRIDYLSLFPVRDMMRANLFTFLDHRDPWARDLRRQPKETLLRTLPGLGRLLGEFEVVGGVQNWIMDLCTVENHERDGVVLIGDAFQTSCPAAGTGVSRLLTDVERLCAEHLPAWMASPGMGRDKIVAFYQDRAKQAADQRALRLAHYRRSLTVETGLRWAVERRQALLRRRVLSWVRDFRAGTGSVPAAVAGRPGG